MQTYAVLCVCVCLYALFIFIPFPPLDVKLLLREKQSKQGYTVHFPSGIPLEDWQKGSGDDHAVSSAVRVTR